MKMAEKKKGFLSGLVEKLDKKMEQKSKEKECGCCECEKKKGKED
jgi:hypothetical protein